MAVPLIVFRREVITLYVGEQYLSAATVMGLLLLLFPVAYGNLMLWKLAQAQARIGEVTRRVVVIQFVALLLTLYLVYVQKMGAIGAALAGSVVTLVGQPLLLWPLGVRMAGTTFNTFWKETLFPGLSPGMLTAYVYVIIRGTVHPGDWLSLGLCTVAGMVFYCIVTLMFYLQPYDRDIIRSTFARLAARGAKNSA